MGIWGLEVATRLGREAKRWWQEGQVGPSQRDVLHPSLAMPF